VLYLGANVPIVRLAEFVNAARPSLALSTAAQLATAATLLEMASFLQGENIPLAFGGRILNRLPVLRTRIPGHFLGPSLELAPQAVEKVMNAPPPTLTVAPVSETSQKTLAHYQERRLLIEAEMLKRRPDFPQQAWPLIANRELARNITAALALGDIDFVDDSIDWIAGLNREGYVLADALDDYLSDYHQAAQTHLDERGAPILNWLSKRKEKQHNFCGSASAGARWATSYSSAPG
jgi:hypothetical protein